MKTGLSTVCLQRHAETETALAEIARLGSEVCEVYLQTFYEYRPEFARKYAANTAVSCIRVNPFNFEAQLYSPSRRIRGDGFYWLDQVLRSAQIFGAKNFVLQSVSADGNRIGEIISFCGRYGVDAVFDVGDPTAFIELKNLNPALKGALNFRSARRCGEYLKDIAGAISIIYLSAEDKNHFKKFFAKLKAAGFDGSVIIDGGADCAEELGNSLKYINDIIYNV